MRSELVIAIIVVVLGQVWLPARRATAPDAQSAARRARKSQSLEDCESPRSARMSGAAAYQRGFQVSATFPPYRDLEAAACWFKLAVAKGDRDAETAVGRSLVEGSSPYFPKDATEGLRLLNLAVSKGSTEAMARLSELYSSGKYLPKDDALSKKWDDAYTTALGPLAPVVVTKEDRARAEANRPDPILSFGNSATPRSTSQMNSKAPLTGSEPSGWERVRWGMTKAQVRQAYPDAKDYDADGTPVFGIERFGIGDTVFQTEFRFKDDVLIGVDLWLGFVFNPELIADNTHGFFSERFTKQFGEPQVRSTSKETTWTWTSPATRMIIYRGAGTPDRTVVHHSLRPGDRGYGISSIDMMTTEIVSGQPRSLLIAFERK